jgi:hypothetical protein
MKIYSLKIFSLFSCQFAIFQLFFLDQMQMLVMEKKVQCFYHFSTCNIRNFFISIIFHRHSMSVYHHHFTFNTSFVRLVYDDKKISDSKCFNQSCRKCSFRKSSNHHNSQFIHHPRYSISPLYTRRLDSYSTLF